MSKQRSHSDNSRRESDSYGFSLHFGVEMPNLGGYFSVVAADLNVVGIDVQFPMVVLIGVVSFTVLLQCLFDRFGSVFP